MNVPWMIEQTESFREVLDQLLQLFDAHQFGGPEWKRAEEIALLREPVFRQIMEALGSTRVGTYQRGRGGMYDESRWQHPRELTVTVLGVLHTLEEVERNLAPQGPQLSAASLHPTVWDSAKTLLASGFPGPAVGAAATAVDAMVKSKIGRAEISGARLMRDTFSPDDPAAGRPRLRFPGDRTTETWKARQGGARDYAAGCFTAIRNPAAHEEDALTEQEGLEQLAAFSVLARWVDECEVEAGNG